MKKESLPTHTAEMFEMQEAVKKELAEAVRETVMEARENSVFTSKGRMFLDANASAYGAAVNAEGQLIDASGKVMDEKHPDYQTIINMAKRQARAQSSIGRDLLGS